MPATKSTPAQSPKRRPQPVPARLVSRVAGGLLVAVPVVVFALTWQYYAVNAPKWDDHALRGYLYFTDQETTLSGKIYQLFKQHNEHRIVYDRIVAALDYRLFGKLSYVHLMAVGDLSLVGLLAVFGAVLLRAGKPIVYAVPVSLLLFNLSQWENMFWGMAALQNFSVVFWVVLTVYWLSYSNRWILAMVSAVLATLTSGNGLLVWPIGFVLLLLQTAGVDSQPPTKSTNRPARVLISWTLAAALVITLYFVGFGKPAGNPPDRGTITDLLKGWLAFTGAAAEPLSVDSPLSISIRLGGLMVLATLGCVAWSLRTHWSTVSHAVQRVLRIRTTESGDEKLISPISLFLWGCAAFIVGTAAIVVWTRTGYGIGLLITSRYKIYSLTLLALLYVYAVGRLPHRAGRWTGAVGAVGSLLIAWLSYNSFVAEVIWVRHYMLTSQFNSMYGTNQPVGRLDAVTKQYTNSAPAFYDSDPAVLYGAGESATWPVTVARTPTGFMVQDRQMIVGDQRDSRAFVVARSLKRTYLFQTRQNQNLVGRARFWPATPFTTGFTAPIPDNELDAGTYRLFVLTVATGGQLTLHPTGRTIAPTGSSAAPVQKNW